MTGSASLKTFLARFYADEDSDGVGSLEHYQQLFPELAAAIAEHWSSLTGSSETRREALSSTGRIAHYELLERIGRGGQGEVWKARDVRLERIVALKVVAGLRSLLPDTEAKRLEREARVVARINHPGICPLFDIDLENDPPFLVMPFLEGRSFAEVLADRESAALSESEAVRGVVTFIEELARTLHAAHEAGVVHRDVKPGNVFVTPSGSPVVLDFGLALESDSEAHVTVTGQRLGTLPYMAPEQVRGELVDRRCDVHALGVLLYESLAGQRPYRGMTQHSLVNAIQNESPTPLHRANPAVSRDLSVVVSTALNKSAAHRYATADALADDLRAVLEHRPIAARPTGTVVRMARWARRNPAMTAAMLFLLAGLVTSLILLRAEAEALERVNVEQAYKQVALDAASSESLVATVGELWPATPEMVTAARGFDWWLESARSLLGRREAYRKQREDLEREARKDDGGGDPRRRMRLARLREALIRHRGALEDKTAKGDEKWIKRLRRDIERAQRQIDHTPPLFDDPADERLHALLTETLRGSDQLEHLIPIIEARREQALTVRERTVERFAAAWAEAGRAVAADARFGGWKLDPVVGLVPLGADPSSGLQEFAHVGTGDVPRRVDGKLVLEEETGIVLVLAPGGDVTFGAIRPDENNEVGDPYVDQWATTYESPLQRTRLDPYMISKYPMTQGQWLRVTGQNPSPYRPSLVKGTTLLHPIDNVSWDDCRGVLSNIGLRLPTEAQWEVAARAGTTTPWWTGSTKQSIDGAGNTADKAALAVKHEHTWTCEEFLDDGYFRGSPIGIFKANHWGLHDVIGNTYEWTNDVFGPYRVAMRPGDGLRLWSAHHLVVARSASFADHATDNRVSRRSLFTKDLRNPYFGVRPCLWPVRGR